MLVTIIMIWLTLVSMFSNETGSSTWHQMGSLVEITRSEGTYGKADHHDMGIRV